MLYFKKKNIFTSFEFNFLKKMCYVPSKKIIICFHPSPSLLKKKFLEFIVTFFSFAKQKKDLKNSLFLF